MKNMTNQKIHFSNNSIEWDLYYQHLKCINNLLQIDNFENTEKINNEEDKYKI